MIINKFVPNTEVFNSRLIEKQDKTKETSENTFKNLLKENLDKVNEKQIQADNLTNEFVSGGDVEIHEMMLGMEEAKMSLQLAIQVRNKMVDAVKELTNMQL